jgi:replicative DNA helicase
MTTPTCSSTSLLSKLADAEDAPTGKLPCDADAERFMLSSAWLSEDADMLCKLSTRDFIDPFHKWLLKILQGVLHDGEPLSIIAVRRRARAPGGQDELGDLDKEYLTAHVAELLTSCPTTVHKDYYFSVLREERVARGILMLLDDIKEKIFAGMKSREILSHLTEQAGLLELLLPADRKDSECQSSTTITRNKGEEGTENP